jgi:hypothetical protein
MQHTLHTTPQPSNPANTQRRTSTQRCRPSSARPAQRSPRECQHALPLGRNSCAQAGRQKAYYQVHCPTTPNSTTFSSLCSHSTGCSGKTGSAVAQGLSHRKRACIGKPLRPVGRPPHMSWHLRQGPSCADVQRLGEGLPRHVSSQVKSANKPTHLQQ